MKRNDCIRWGFKKKVCGTHRQTVERGIRRESGGRRAPVEKKRSDLLRREGSVASTTSPSPLPALRSTEELALDTFAPASPPHDAPIPPLHLPSLSSSLRTHSPRLHLPSCSPRLSRRSHPFLHLPQPSPPLRLRRDRRSPHRRRAPRRRRQTSTSRPPPSSLRMHPGRFRPSNTAEERWDLGTH